MSRKDTLPQEFDFFYCGKPVCRKTMEDFMTSVLPTAWIIVDEDQTMIFQNELKCPDTTKYTKPNFTKLYKPFGWSARSVNGKEITGNGPTTNDRLDRLERNVRALAEAVIGIAHTSDGVKPNSGTLASGLNQEDLDVLHRVAERRNST